MRFLSQDSHIWKPHVTNDHHTALHRSRMFPSSQSYWAVLGASLREWVLTETLWRKGSTGTLRPGCCEDYVHRYWSHPESPRSSIGRSGIQKLKSSREERGGMTQSSQWCSLMAWTLECRDFLKARGRLAQKQPLADTCLPARCRGYGSRVPGKQHPGGEVVFCQSEKTRIQFWGCKGLCWELISTADIEFKNWGRVGDKIRGQYARV